MSRPTNVMIRRTLVLGATVLAVLLSACSSAGEEPEGLTGDATTVSATTPPSAAPSGAGDDPDASPSRPAPEPGATFTPLFLPPDAERVVELPSELPIEPPDDATDEERAVLRAVGRFMASWDAVLFGAGDEQSGILRTAVDPQLGRLLTYLVESVTKQRVVVGEPTRIELRDITVGDGTAEVDICTIMRDWVQYTGGTPEPQPEVERLVLTMKLVDDAWLASDTEQADPEPCE